MSLLLVAAACSDDAAGAPDAATPDAATPDADPGGPRWYVASDVLVAASNAEATMFALDLDGDAREDNALGHLLATLEDFAEGDIAGSASEAVAAGDLVFLQYLDALTLVDAASAVVRLRRGAGSDPFAVVPTAGADGDLSGAIAAGELSAGGGQPAPLPLAIFQGQAPIWLTAIGARVEATVSAGAWSEGRVGGGLPVEEVDKLFEPMAEGISALIARDCPEQTCEPDSSGGHLRGLFDGNDDYVVDVEELQQSDLIEGTIRNPDLDLLDEGGDFNPNADGIKESLSFCFGIASVAAAVE